MAAADFWNNQAAAQTTVIELKGLNSLLKPMDEAIRVDEEIQTLVEMGDDDPSFIPEYDPQAHGTGSQRSQAILLGYSDGFLGCNIVI